MSRSSAAVSLLVTLVLLSPVICGQPPPPNPPGPAINPRDVEDFQCNVTYRHPTSVILLNTTWNTWAVSATLGIPDRNVTFVSAWSVPVPLLPPETRVEVQVRVKKDDWDASSMTTTLFRDLRGHIRFILGRPITAACDLKPKRRDQSSTRPPGEGSGSHGGSATTPTPPMQTPTPSTPKPKRGKYPPLQVQSKLTLGMTVEAATQAKDQIRTDIALSLDVPTENVTILSILPGSTVIEFEVESDGYANETELLAQLNESFTNNATMQTQYQTQTIIIVRVTEVSPSTPSPPQVVYEEDTTAIILVVVVAVVMLLLIAFVTAVSVVMLQRDNEKDAVTPMERKHLTTSGETFSNNTTEPALHQSGGGSNNSSGQQQFVMTQQPQNSSLSSSGQQSASLSSQEALVLKQQQLQLQQQVQMQQMLLQQQQQQLLMQHHQGAIAGSGSNVSNDGSVRAVQVAPLPPPQPQLLPSPQPLFAPQFQQAYAPVNQPQ